MEPHPVPQNIIDVEFKLFGSFTIKQFAKILLGCLIGLVIYTININPLIKIPLAAGSVILGLGMAIMPNLGTWIVGFVKAIFVSPRYVWVKETRVPELLAERKIQTAGNDQSVSSASNKKRLDIDEIPLDKIFASRGSMNMQSDVKLDNIETPKDDNFYRIYEDVFGTDVVNSNHNPYLNAAASLQQNQSQPQVEQPKQIESVDLYMQELDKLKKLLENVNKNAKIKEKEQEIIDRINFVHKRIQELQGVSVTKNANISKKEREIKYVAEGRVVYGIVVSKNDQPISNCNLLFTEVNQNSKIQFTNGSDGKFNTVDPLPKGDYLIEISHPKYKFHKYRITIADQPLPGYKFREK
jgi:hypothetical protein